MKLRVLVLVLVALRASTVVGAVPDRAVAPLVRALMASEEELRGVPFAEVLHAATGKQVVPLVATNAVDRELLGKIGAALDRVLARLNAPDGPVHREKRINEASSHFESALKAALNEVPGFACDFPKNAAGRTQRTGYPDLRLADQASGRVVFLDPKLFDQNSRGSSLRTFYFEPKTNTNKVHEDAHHLIVGFAHAGREDAQWKFVSWELVDLARFRVRFKAEFQAGNRDLYQPDNVVGRSLEPAQRP